MRRRKRDRPPARQIDRPPTALIALNGRSESGVPTFAGDQLLSLRRRSRRVGRRLAEDLARPTRAARDALAGEHIAGGVDERAGYGPGLFGGQGSRRSRNLGKRG
jgi:hypothetical protein